MERRSQQEVTGRESVRRTGSGHRWTPGQGKELTLGVDLGLDVDVLHDTDRSHSQVAVELLVAAGLALAASLGQASLDGLPGTARNEVKNKGKTTMR